MALLTRITHLPQPFGRATAVIWAAIALWVWVAFALRPRAAQAQSLASPPPEPASQPVLTWLGTTSAAMDAAYHQFQQALVRQPLPRRAVQLRYVVVPDAGPQAVEQALRSRTGLPPAVWVAPTADTAQAVRRLYPAQRLVFAIYPNPVGLDLVASLARPGGRATGLMLGDTLAPKRLELLRDAFPRTRVVGVLLDRSWAENNDLQTALLGPGHAMGLDLRIFYAEEPAEVDRLFASAQARRVQAWYIADTYIAYRARLAIQQHLARLARPAIHTQAADVAQGALMAYSQDTRFIYDSWAELATRVAAGEDPADIPVQRPMRTVLSVRAGQSVPGLRVNPSVLRRADRIY